MTHFKVIVLLQIVARITQANLLLGGTATDQEPLNCSPSETNDGILSGLAFYHAGGSLANNWLDIQTTTQVTVNTILFLSGD